VIDVAVSADIKFCAKGSRKEVKIQEFVYRDKSNVAREMYDCTGHNCSQRNGKKSFVVRSGSHTSKTFNRFTTKESYTWNITHNKENTAV